MRTYQEITPEILTKLQQAAPGHVYTGDEINEDYSHDEMQIYGSHMPDVLIIPTSTEEISAVMKICNEHRVPVATRGAGTAETGAPVPLYGGVLLSTEKFNHIKSFHPDDMSVTIEPGVLLFDLAQACTERGFLYPPDPGEKFATVGGNVSTNAGGMRAVLYGTTKDYVNSIEAVLADGTITRFGADVCKSSTGYNLKDLIIGSEGTLAIITELTLKILPAPGIVASLIVPFENMHDAIRTVSKVKNSNIKPQALEFMERSMVEMSEKHIQKEVFPKSVEGIEAQAYLLITIEADDEESLYAKIEKASELVLEAGAIDVLVADNPAKMKEAWAARSGFVEAIKALSTMIDECDVVVPVSKIADYLEEAEAIGEECGLTMRCYGHAGDGNLHIKVCTDSLSQEEFLKRSAMCLDKLYDKAVTYGGLLSGEHGVGSGKRQYLERFVGKTNMMLMTRIKQAFDPNMILNPGKVCYDTE